MPDGLAYLAAVTLSGVFAYSAITKMRDARPARRALAAAGVRGSGVIAKAVPGIELIIAGVLLVRPSTGAVAALGLLAVFTLFVIYLLARRLDVSCGCFGTNATETVSMTDIVRNAMLFALAVIAGSVSTPSGVAMEEVIAATTAVAIGGVALAAVSTRRRLGQLFDNRLPGGQ